MPAKDERRAELDALWEALAITTGLVYRADQMFQRRIQHGLRRLAAARKREWPALAARLELLGERAADPEFPPAAPRPARAVAHAPPSARSESPPPARPLRRPRILKT
jgi:hypothetical protein